MMTSHIQKKERKKITIGTHEFGPFYISYLMLSYTRIDINVYAIQHNTMTFFYWIFYWIIGRAHSRQPHSFKISFLRKQSHVSLVPYLVWLISKISSTNIIFVKYGYKCWIKIRSIKKTPSDTDKFNIFSRFLRL